MLFAPRSRKIEVYSTPTTHFVIGEVGAGLYRVLFFERSSSAAKLSDILYADPKLYDRRRRARLLRLAAPRTTSERRRGRSDDLDSAEQESSETFRGEVPIHRFDAAALLGVFRFLKGYYLLFVTEKKRVGYINGHVIYSIGAVKLFPITEAHVSQTATNANMSSVSATSADEDSAGSIRNKGWSWLGASRDPVDELESRYLSLFQLIDLTKGDFFFSYTLDLTNYLQKTFARESVDDTFAWNDYITMELRETIMFDEQQRLKRRNAPDIPPEAAKNLLWTSDSWLTPLIHGSFQQQRFSLLGKAFTLTLIGRRSRHNAGTRYLKRGVNEQGKVANHVEVEQIVEVEGVAISSFVQMRGSIPTYWTQDTSAVTPKPPIKRFRSDPTFLATRLHFSDLMTRYGEPIIVLNLVRRAEYEKSQREAKLGEEFADAVELLNCSLAPEERIIYDAVDFKRLSKVGTIGMVLDEIARKDLERLGVFCTDSSTWSFQQGTVRTNCIDCLDRTNAGQFYVGLCALGIQLDRLQLTLPLSKSGAITGPLLDKFVEMFEDLGDQIAQQYGGSQAHKKGGAAAPTSELLTSIRRYYNNSFTDRPKQDAINLFLGCFIPRKVHQVVNGKLVEDESSKAVWDMESDFYLHNLRVTDRSSFTLKTDPGTERWWFGRPGTQLVQQSISISEEKGNAGSKGVDDELVRRYSSTSQQQLALMSSPSPSPPPRPPATFSVIRPPLSDEDDSGVFVQFDRVLNDPFFRPVEIGKGNDEKLGAAEHRSIRDRLFPSEGKNPLLMLNESGISSTTAGITAVAPPSDDDEEFHTHAIEGHSHPRSSRLGSLGSHEHNTVAASSAPNSLLMGSSLEEDPADLASSLLLGAEQVRSSFVNDSFDFLGSVHHRLCGEIPLFAETERIASQTEVAFEYRSVDPAILEYMQDFIVPDSDVAGIRRVIVEANAVAGIVPNGAFGGFERGKRVAELYSTKADSASVFAFEASLEPIIQEQSNQREIFEQYLRSAAL